MQTEYLGLIDRDRLDLALPLLDRAAQKLQQGGIVAFPTETVYGLGGSIFCEKALLGLYAVKGRKSSHPLPIQLAYPEQLRFVIKKVPFEFDLLAKAFLPGPLTLIMESHPDLSPIISAKLDSVAVRFPSDPIAKELIRRVGAPLAVSSANLTGKLSATCAAHVFEDFNGKIDAIVDGGPTQYGVESTVLSLKDQAAPKILRLGAIGKQALERVLQRPIAVDLNAQLALKGPSRSPKMTAMVRLFSSWEEIDIYLRLSAKSKRFIMSDQASPPPKEIDHYFPLLPSNLYDRLRMADREGYAEVIVLCDRKLKEKPYLIDCLKNVL